MSRFTPLDTSEEDINFTHINPFNILEAKIEYPTDRAAEYDVVLTTVSGYEHIYTFSTIEEARNLIRRLGAVD